MLKPTLVLLVSQINLIFDSFIGFQVFLGGNTFKPISLEVFLNRLARQQGQCPGFLEKSFIDG